MNNRRGEYQDIIFCIAQVINKRKVFIERKKVLLTSLLIHFKRAIARKIKNRFLIFGC
jgi:hypothetical protein